MTVIIGLKTCDTCRKARKALVGAEFRDVRAAPLARSEIGRFAQAFGDALVNRKSTTWRSIPDGERNEAVATLIERYPTLMKRPVIDGPGGLTIGWSAEIAAQHEMAAG